MYVTAQWSLHCSLIEKLPSKIHGVGIPILLRSASQFLGDLTQGRSASDLVVQAFRNIAKSNKQVCGRNPRPMNRSDSDAML